jgi:hypothetical protein
MDALQSLNDGFKPLVVDAALLYVHQQGGYNRGCLACQHCIQLQVDCRTPELEPNNGSILVTRINIYT